MLVLIREDRTWNEQELAQAAKEEYDKFTEALKKGVSEKEYFYNIL